MSTSWDLSPIYQSSRNATLCPKGGFVASTLNDRLVIRDVRTLDIIRSWKLDTRDTDWNVTVMEAHPPHCVVLWSKKQSTLLVYRPDDDELVAKIDVGGEGVEFVYPFDQSLLGFASHKLRATMYDLTGSNAPASIERPKWNTASGITSRPDHSVVALLERHDGRDSLGVYDRFSLLRHVPLPDNANFSDVSWSPCGRFILLLASTLQPRMLICTPDGRFLFDSGNDMQSLEPVMAHAWHPSGDFLATLDLSGMLSIRYRTSWLAVEQIPLSATATTQKADVYREPREWRTQARGAGIVKFEPSSGPIEHAAADGTQPRTYRLSFAPSGSRIAVWSSDNPRTIQIIDFSVHPVEGRYGIVSNALVTVDPIKSLVWQPNAGFDDSEDALVVLSGDRSFVVWRTTRSGVACEGVAIPAGVPFVPNAASFDSNGQHVLLSGPVSYLVASKSSGGAR